MNITSDFHYTELTPLGKKTPLGLISYSTVGNEFSDIAIVSAARAPARPSTRAPTDSAPLPKHPPKHEAPQVSKPIVALGEDKKELIKGIRKAMVRKMTEAQSIPHFGYCDEVDLSHLVQMRAELRDAAAGRGVKLTYMPVFIKVCVHHICRGNQAEISSS